MSRFARLYGFARTALLPACAVVLLSCRENALLLDPLVEPPPQNAVELECTANVRTATLSCQPPLTGIVQRGASGDLIVGGQNVYVKMISDSIVVSGGLFSFDARMQNLIRQPMNTTDGMTPAAGIRIFFHNGPAAQPSGTVTVNNADGVGTFTSADQPYFLYNPEQIDVSDGMLQQFDTTGAKTWTLAFTPEVTTFTFRVLISAPVQYPNGWVGISPDPVPALLVGSSIVLSDSVFTALGQHQPSETVNWTSSADAIATVDGAGEVRAIAPGTATITATTGGGVTGSVTVTVTTDVSTPDHEYEALGNVARIVGAPGVLTGASIGASVVPAVMPTEQGGTINLASNGSFTYVSPVGFAGGRDSVQYIATNGMLEDTAWVKFTVSAAHVWYVQNNFAGTGTGTSMNPFTSLADALAAAPAGDTILVYRGDGSSSGHAAITLLAGHALLGEGMRSDLIATLDGAPVTYFEGTGNAPRLGGTVTLGQGNTIAGVFIETTTGAAIFGNNYVTTHIRETALRTTGSPVLNLTNGGGVVHLDSVFSTGSSGRGMFLRDITGVVRIDAGSISGAEATGIQVMRGAPDSMRINVDVTSPVGGRPIRIDSLVSGLVVFSGDINAVGNGLLVRDNNGGDIRFTGASKVFNTGVNHAINMGNNHDATVSFENGGLAITTTRGDGFNVNRTGLRVSGTNNTISSVSGSPLWLSNLDLVGDVRFRSISVDSAGVGCGCGGIYLDQVRGDSALYVTGTGAPGSGGSVHGVFTVGVSIEQSTAPVYLRNMTLSADSSGVAVQAVDFGLLDLQGTSISATNGAGALGALLGTITGTMTSITTDSLAVFGAIFSGVDGSLTVSNGSIEGSGFFFIVDSGTLDFTYGGDVIHSGVFPLLFVASGHTGTLTFGGTIVSGNTGLIFDEADGNYNFNGALTLNGDAALQIFSSAGSFNFNSNTSITADNAMWAVGIDGGAPNLNFNGTITTSGLTEALNVTGLTGGNININGPVVSTSLGISLTSNTGGAITFTDSVVINPTDGVGAVLIEGNSGFQASFTGGLRASSDGFTTFIADDGGTIAITGSNNTLQANGAAAMSIVNTAIHASGVTFRSVSADGAGHGIELANTGAGTFRITGDGSTGMSGGTIMNADTAVMLDNSSADLGYMHIANSNSYGVHGVNSGVRIQNSSFEGNLLEHVHVQYDGLAAGTVSFLNNSLGSHGPGSGGGIALRLGDSSAYTGTLGVNVSGNTITGSIADAILVSYIGPTGGALGQIQLDIHGNTIGSATPSSCSSTGAGIRLDHQFDATAQLTVVNNTVSNCIGAGIDISTGSGDDGVINTIVRGNSVDNGASANEPFRAIVGSPAGSSAFCLDLGGAAALANTLVRNSGAAIAVTQNSGLFRIAGSPADPSDSGIQAFLAARNNGASVAAASTTGFTATSTCGS